jgi:hypothetical protein
VKQLILIGVVVAFAAVIAGCGGSGGASEGTNATASATKKATAKTTPAALNASQQQTVGAAVGYAISRCTIGNVPGGGSQDGQISSALNDFVALYKKAGGQVKLSASKPTTLSAEAQTMTDELKCDPSLSQILVSGAGTISRGAAATTTATTTSNPEAKAACTKILGDVPSLGTGVNAIGQYGKDVAKLMPVVSGSQQTTVIKSVGDIEKVLQAISVGSSGTAAIQAMARDARQIGAICSGYLSNP